MTHGVFFYNNKTNAKQEKPRDDNEPINSSTFFALDEKNEKMKMNWEACRCLLKLKKECKK
jgi:hypothetical protein